MQPIGKKKKQLNGNSLDLLGPFRKVPFVLLTNGGGVTEEEKAKQISEIVGVKACALTFFFFFLNNANCVRNKQIDPKAVVLSHSPMQNLADKYRDKRVLIVGGSGRKCFDVAKK